MNEKQKSEIGKAVRELRLNTGKNRQAFADSCNMDVTQLLKIEEGRSEPGLITIFRLADGLDRTPSQLIGIIHDRLKAKGLLDGFRMH